ncbi:serine/threonine-protein phosphatase, partial [Pseudoalteromonas sp. S1688]
ERYYILCVGDSRAYLLSNSKLTQVSRDLSQVNDLIDEGMISVEEAKNHPLSNVITSDVAVIDEVKVDGDEGDI